MENKDFQSVLQYCIKSNLYLGEGNPNAKILFIGQEIGYGSEKKEDKFPDISEIKEKSNEITNDNLRWWQERCQSNYVEKYLKDIERLFEEKPNPTWRSYQKIVNQILGRSVSDKKFDFLNYSFITEYSQLSLPKNSYKPEDKKAFEAEKTNSINRRQPLFDEDFFQNFPVVIMACGHYPTIDFPMNIEEVFGVKWIGETKVLSKGNFYNLHYGKTKNGQDKILIHTRQVSMNVTDDLLKEIGQVIREFLWKNDNDFRWNNGGKEIYNAFQNSVEYDYVNSPEYKKYMKKKKKFFKDSMANLIIPQKRKGKYGYINSKGEEIIPFEYDWIVSYKDDYNVFFGVSKNDKFGTIGLDGKILLPVEYNCERQDFNFGRKKTDKTTGKVSFVIGKNENKKFGIVGSNGKMILPLEYDYDMGDFVYWENVTYAVVKKNEKWGIITFDGKIILPSEYDDIESFWSENDKIFFIVKKNEKYGVTDLNGKIKLPFEYDNINFVKEKITTIN